MINAIELYTKQKEREKIKYKTYDIIYKSIEKKIILASSTNFYYIWYQLPEFIIGYPKFNIDDCKQNIINKLKLNKFIIEEYYSNLLLIQWFNI